MVKRPFTPFLSRLARVAVVCALVLAWSPGAAVANHKYNGGGTCWDTDQAWTNHFVYYYIGGTIPSNWRTYIHSSASAWNAANNNSVAIIASSTDSYQNLLQVKGFGSGASAGRVVKISFTSTTLKRVEMTFNANRPIYPHQLFPEKEDKSFDVQNLATHEFGHFGWINDMPDTDRDPQGNLVSCRAQTMWNDFGYGDQTRRSLETYDTWAINWQYP